MPAPTEALHVNNWIDTGGVRSLGERYRRKALKKGTLTGGCSQATSAERSFPVLTMEQIKYFRFLRNYNVPRVDALKSAVKFNPKPNV